MAGTVDSNVVDVTVVSSAEEIGPETAVDPQPLSLNTTVTDDDNEDQTEFAIDWLSMSIAYFSCFVDLAGVSIILPIIPFLVLDFGGDPSQYGFIVAAYALAQMISVPISGRLSDMYGRKTLLLVSLLGQSPSPTLILTLTLIRQMTSLQAPAVASCSKVSPGVWRSPRHIFQ